MMVVTLASLDEFHAFAQQKVKQNGNSSLHELVDLWAEQASTDAELQASLTALNEGLDDAEAGQVRPARDVFDDLATRYGTSLP